VQVCKVYLRRSKKQLFEELKQEHGTKNKALMPRYIFQLAFIECVVKAE